MANALRSAITGLGSAVPEKALSNEDFEKFLETSDEWITQRTGIRQRRIAGEGESTASLGALAGRRALADAGVEAKDLDLILCATISPEMIFPATACFIQRDLGATNVPAFDISAACSGFLYGLSIADGFIRSGAYRRILVIGAEALSRFTDYTDRGSCILFGDGAGAAVVEATEQPGRGIRYFKLGADGEGWDYIHVPGGGARTPASHETVDQRLHYIHLRGRDVYKFAVTTMHTLMTDAMDKCNLRPEDVDLVVPHQVNLRIIESAAEKVNFPMDKVYVNIDRYGNTSAASIPIALTEAKANGRIQPGSTLLMVAFGAGLTYASTVMTW